MRIPLIITLCLLFAAAAFAQPKAEIPVPETVGVVEFYLAKANSEGKAGDAVEGFLTTDIPIFCVVQLNSTKPAIVKMNLVAVSVPGVKAETRVIAVSFKTNGTQDRVSFKGKPDKVWIAGNYRVDIFVDDKLVTGKSFEIKKSPSEIQKTTAPVGSFVPPKPKPKAKIVKQTRKN